MTYCLTYRAEDSAFVDTPAGDRFTAASLMAETLEIARHPAIWPMVGDVDVIEGPVTMHATTASATDQLIKFAPGRSPRFVAVHELAHVATRRSGLRVDGVHGSTYRAVYLALVESVYGRYYADLLRHGFAECRLDVADVNLPIAPTPVLDIDALAQASGGSRWIV